MTTRRPRHQRVTPEARPPFRLTERDVLILKAVNDCRALKNSQIQTAFFNSASPTYTRLEKLYHHEYLERKFITQVATAPGSSPMVNVITKLGAEVLVNTLGYDLGQINFPGREVGNWDSLQHILAIAEFRVRLIRACLDTPGFTLVDWVGEEVFRRSPDYVILEGEPNSKKGKGIPVYPDGYCILKTPRGETRFFVEIDRGTEGLKQFKSQMRIYQQYLTSGLYQQRFKTDVLRILVIAPNPSRAKTLATAIHDVGGRDRYWISHIEALTPSTVLNSSIWQRGDGQRDLALVPSLLI